MLRPGPRSVTPSKRPPGLGMPIGIRFLGGGGAAIKPGAALALASCRTLHELGGCTTKWFFKKVF